VLAYGALAYAFTWTVAAPQLLASRGLIDAPDLHWLEPIAAFGPFVAGMLVARAIDGRNGPRRILHSLMHWRVGWGPAALAAFSPVVLLLLAAGGVAAGGGLQIDPERPQLLRLATAAGIFQLVLVGAVVQAWGEEPGWRGFMLARLRVSRGPLAASLILFPVWLLWHLPFFLSRPEFGLPQWLGFSAGILSASIWLTLVWDATGSVLMALIWHAAVNICRGIALAVSPTLFLAVSNSVLIGAVAIVAYWFWRARRERSARIHQAVPGQRTA
jgi:membrane protease YdiL (CAAX protease family)